MKAVLASATAHRQFFRFLAVGLLNTAFGYGCYVLLVYFGCHYTIAYLVATVLGILFNFKTIGKLVFRSNDNRLLFRFISVYGVVYGVNVSGVKALSLIGLGPYASAAMMLLPAAAISYHLNKRFVFRNDKTD
ncbi:GtrA family protein [Bordetella bronchialis]|uniref:Polysaccharide biosynthesis protein GtrA n=1 Tax=Bordetella bronchialis TaxID=463025 RepID=A0A193FN64_9BORD|nr:GtrA family protein [Bordetella bronchialis]ANN69100.1 polysaccharide biosynthesis protein GtrA [Bordetella bronchialis]ANN74248.1 polysaccharide biosynthesis protein GtrA [Bordetella bronchialis]